MSKLFSSSFFKASVVCFCFDLGRRTCMILVLQREVVETDGTDEGIRVSNVGCARSQRDSLFLQPQLGSILNVT